VYVLDRTGAAFTVLPPRVEAVDATGAGDALRAGLLFGLAQDWDLPRAVCLGVAAGSLAVQQFGAATTLPALDEVAALAATLQPAAAP
jgi:sugar/nucleoside kinase (ribokinase family)